MTFIASPSILQKILLIFILFSTVLSACDLFLCLRRKGKPYYNTIIECVILAISSFILVNLAVCIDKNWAKEYPNLSLQVANLPIWIFILVEVVLISLCAVAIVSGFRLDKHSISKMSIKESFDNLPSGICFYEESGVLLLVNVKISELCLKITGKSLLNGVDFWKTLTNKTPNIKIESLETNQTPMIKIDDKNVFLFNRIEHIVDGEKIYEIVAIDITRRYNLSEDLSRKNKEMELFNTRMREYGENIQQLTIETETLNAKIRIHDELGKLLLFTRKSLLEELTSDEKHKLLSIWKNDLTTFDITKEEKVTKTYSELYAAAKSVGISLKIMGKKPENKKLKKILVTTSIECITNAVKHAKANQVYVKLFEKNAFLHIIVTNNGEPPKTKIKEGGGFTSLRQLVEREGGNMIIKSNPNFELEITVPKGEIV